MLKLLSGDGDSKRWGAPTTMPDLTTVSIPLDPSTHHDSLTENLRDRGFAIAGLPEAPRDDVVEVDELQQGELPTGPTHVASRRTKDQLTSARQFIAAAGRVKFDRGRATLKAVWMTVAYYASLGAGPERVCFAQVETLANRALVSERTIRTHLAALAGHGLIQTNHRTGGHAPTKWEVSPSVLGGRDCRAGRQELPGRAARIADEVSNRSLAPTGPELLLASKQQPDGACAPPPAARKKPAQKTEKKKQPTRTAEPTQTLAQVKTDTGGNPRGGATDGQIKFLNVLADKVGAEPAEDLWRAADSKRLQVQMDAAKPFKDLKVKHTHGVDVEAVTVVWNDKDHALGAMKSCVQRCACGAARSVMISRSGGVSDLLFGLHKGWKLVGHIVNYDTYASGLAVNISNEVQKEHDTGDDRIIDLTDRWRAQQMPMSYVAALIQSLPNYRGSEDCWTDSVVPVDKLDG